MTSPRRYCLSLLPALVIANGAMATNRIAPQIVDTVAVASTRPTAPRDSADAVATIRSVFAAAERGDFAALDSLYAGESLTVVEGAGINRGWADYRDHHLAPEVKVMKDFFYRPVDIEAHVSGETAWVLFRYNLKAEMNGRMIDNVGRGTAILIRRGTAANSRWVVRHIQTSSRARRAGDLPAE